MNLSAQEEASRRKAMREALINAQLEGLEPDPLFFVYVERYAHGDMTLAEILADYSARLTTATPPTHAR